MGSREESLPGFSSDFPYIASRAELDKYPGQFVPWHWHQAVELFFIESGSLEYYTPVGTVFSRQDPAAWSIPTYCIGQGQQVHTEKTSSCFIFLMYPCLMEGRGAG